MVQELFKTHADGEIQILELALPMTLDNVELDRLADGLLGAVTTERPARWIIDLTQVRYMGSAMLGLIINVRQQVKTSGGQLVLCGLSDPLHRIFQACCMERLFTIARTRSEAARIVGRR
jgi:anti-anti-sigma factor